MIISVRLLSKQKSVPDGFRELDPDGYVWVKDTNTFSPTFGRAIKEHILVMERIRGAVLPRGAQVHHIDCNTENNAPNNLAFFTSRESHQATHNRMRAIERFGHPDMFLCQVCKRGGFLQDMVALRVGYKHTHCRAAAKPPKKYKKCETPHWAYLDKPTLDRVLREQKEQHAAKGIVS